MRLVKYNQSPFRLLSDLHGEIDRLFDPAGFFPRDLLAEDVVLSPSVNISEDKDNIYVEADLPGFDQKNINAKIKGDSLVIAAQQEDCREKKKRNYYYCERRQGSFYRALKLSGAVDTAKMNAKYKSGVLRVTLPKKEETKENEIKIEGE